MAAVGSQLTIVFVAYQRGVGTDGLIDALRHHGSRVLPAATGREAEALVRKQGSVDLVILALPPGAPEMTGEASAVVHRWGSRGPHVPLMLISATPPPDEVLARVAWWLAWPLPPDTLLAAIRDTLGG
jgi:DNA-binding response OmpR family regulator